MIGVFRNIIWHTSPYFKYTSSYLPLMLITATSVFNIIIHAHVSFYYQKVSNSVPLYIFGYHKIRKGPEPNNNVFDSGPFFGGDGGLPVMYTTVPSPSEGYIMAQIPHHVNHRYIFAPYHYDRYTQHMIVLRNSTLGHCSNKPDPIQQERKYVNLPQYRQYE